MQKSISNFSPSEVKVFLGEGGGLSVLGGGGLPQNSAKTFRQQQFLPGGGGGDGHPCGGKNPPKSNLNLPLIVEDTFRRAPFNQYRQSLGIGILTFVVNLRHHSQSNSCGNNVNGPVSKSVNYLSANIGRLGLKALSWGIYMRSNSVDNDSGNGAAQFK